MMSPEGRVVAQGVELVAERVCRAGVVCRTTVPSGHPLEGLEEAKLLRAVGTKNDLRLLVVHGSDAV
jgi:ferredoxin